MESFWQRFLPAIYPNDPSGPYLLSLQSKKDLSAAVLNALQENGPSGSPEPISAEAMKLIQEEWRQLRRVGILGFMKGALRSGHRTAAYYYKALGRDEANRTQGCSDTRSDRLPPSGWTSYANLEARNGRRGRAVGPTGSTISQAWSPS
jgi:hypothetical protein